MYDVYICVNICTFINIYIYITHYDIYNIIIFNTFGHFLWSRICYIESNAVLNFFFSIDALIESWFSIVVLAQWNVSP